MGLRRARPFAWLAILAIAALALAPTVSRLLAPPLAPSEQAALCGAGAPRAANESPAGRDGTAAATLAHLESCAYCGPAFAGLAPLPSVSAWCGETAAQRPSSITPPLPPVVATAWRPALPRAPPGRA